MLQSGVFKGPKLIKFSQNSEDSENKLTKFKVRILFPVMVTMAGLTLTWGLTRNSPSSVQYTKLRSIFWKKPFWRKCWRDWPQTKVKTIFKSGGFFNVRVHKVNQAHPDRRAHRDLPLQLLKASSSHLMITRGMSRLQKMWSSSKMLLILLRWTKTKHFPTGEIPSCVPTRESTPRWRPSGDVC